MGRFGYIITKIRKKGKWFFGETGEKVCGFSVEIDHLLRLSSGRISFAVPAFVILPDAKKRWKTLGKTWKTSF
jgi:hypothetical protein